MSSKRPPGSTLGRSKEGFGRIFGRIWEGLGKNLEGLGGFGARHGGALLVPWF